MLYKLAEKNKFGGDTWQIKVDSLFHIFINRTNNNSFLVEIKEWIWVHYKERNTYISESDFETTVRDSFNQLQHYLNGTGKYEWSDSQKNNKLNLVLSILKDVYEPSISVRKKYSALLEEFENSEEAYLIKETDNYVQYYWEFPESNTKSTYAVREIHDKLRVEWSQSGRLGDLEDFWEFDLSHSQKEIKKLVNQKIAAITYVAESNKFTAAFDIKPDLPEEKYASQRTSSAEAFNIPPDMVESPQIEKDSLSSTGLVERQNKYFKLSRYLLKFILEKTDDESTAGEYLEALIFASYMVATKMEPTSEVNYNKAAMLNQLYLFVVAHETLPYMISSDIKLFLSERYVTIQEEMLKFENKSGYYFPKLVYNLYIDSLNQLNPSVDKILEKLELEMALEFKRKFIFFLKRLDKTLISIEKDFGA